MNIDELMDELNSLTVLNAVKLAKKLEREWGVSSAILYAHRLQVHPSED